MSTLQWHCSWSVFFSIWAHVGHPVGHFGHFTPPSPVNCLCWGFHRHVHTTAAVENVMYSAEHSSSIDPFATKLLLWFYFAAKTCSWPSRNLTFVYKIRENPNTIFVNTVGHFARPLPPGNQCWTPPTSSTLTTGGGGGVPKHYDKDCLPGGMSCLWTRPGVKKKKTLAVAYVDQGDPDPELGKAHNAQPRTWNHSHSRPSAKGCKASFERQSESSTAGVEPFVFMFKRYRQQNPLRLLDHMVLGMVRKGLQSNLKRPLVGPLDFRKQERSCILIYQFAVLMGCNFWCAKKQ